MRIGERVLLRGRGGRVLDEGHVVDIDRANPARALIRWSRAGGLRATSWATLDVVERWEGGATVVAHG